VTCILFYDAVAINKWRFMELKEHMQGDFGAENEAYERYTQNVGLLEETLSPMEDADVEAWSWSNFSSEEGRMDLLVSGAKVRLKSDNEIAGAFNYLGAEAEETAWESKRRWGWQTIW
jgi:hypothetical protein